MSKPRDEMIDKLQAAVHPGQAERVPVLAWGKIADFVLAECAASRIDQMLVEQEAYRNTLDRYRASNPDTKLPKGLTIGFQKRMDALKRTAGVSQ